MTKIEQVKNDRTYCKNNHEMNEKNKYYYKGKFLCRTCRSKALEKRKHKKIIISCVICNNKFERISMLRSKTCSELCYSKFQSAAKIKYGIGSKKIPEYEVWVGIKKRCFNSKIRQYKDYGGRGITVCNEWVNSFESFYKDMGPRPSSKYSLDRIDNNGNYEPSNCRWTTRFIQAINKRYKKGITPYLGVSPVFKKTEFGQKIWTGRYCISIRRNGKRFHLGYSISAVEGMIIRKEWLKKNRIEGESYAI